MSSAVSGNVNRWTEPEWALRYLRERDAIPHRVEGLEVLVNELLPERVERVLDLGTGDGNTLALVLAARPDATGVGSTSRRRCCAGLASGSRATTASTIRAHDLDDPLPADLGRFDSSCRASRSTTSLPDRQRALYGEVSATACVRVAGSSTSSTSRPERDELHKDVPGCDREDARDGRPVEQARSGAATTSNGSTTWAFATSSAFGSGGSSPVITGELPDTRVHSRRGNPTARPIVDNRARETCPRRM